MYLFTISSPDIDNIAMSLYNVICGATMVNDNGNGKYDNNDNQRKIKSDLKKEYRLDSRWLITEFAQKMIQDEAIPNTQNVCDSLHCSPNLGW